MKETRIPTIFGILFLGLSLIAGVFLTTSSRTIFSSKASGDCSPINPQVTNITNSSADISFTTTADCSASVSANNQLVEDVKPGNKIHYFQVKNLKASSNYSYTVISSGQNITNDSFIFKTAQQPSSSVPTSNLAWGRVFNSDMKTVAAAIVYLNVPGASPLSSFVTSNGNWSISLANSFNEDRNNWFLSPSVPTEEEIIVISEDGQATQITHTTATNNPVPDIIIGQNSISNYTFESGVIISVSPVKTEKKLEIINPKDGDNLPASRPDFFGTAPLNSKIIIEVHSPTPITGDTQSDASGSWHWSPPADLAPGEHTIIVKVQNPVSGIWETITKNFTVLATDNNLSYQASSSANIATITLTPTPTLISTPTSVPSLILPTNTLVPTIRTAHPSTTSAPPVTGNSLPTIVIIISALTLFLISFKFIQ